MALKTLRAYNGSARARRNALNALAYYETVCQTKKSYLSAYEEVLCAEPWSRCSCTLCRTHGIEIAIFRGTERNKRRGFHNLTVLADKMTSLYSLNSRSSRG